MVSEQLPVEAVLINSWWNEFVDHERRSSRGKDGPVLYAYV